MFNILMRGKKIVNRALRSLSRKFVIKNIKRSNVQHEELIHDLARVTDCNISGQVRISKNTKIQNSRLFGKIEIGDHCSFDQILISGNVQVGRRTALNGPSQIISMPNPVTIGNFCSIAAYVLIQEYNHPLDRCSTSFVHKHLFGGTMQQDVVSRGPITIGNDVWIGTQTVITSGTVISDGAVIGANSTVTGTIPPYAIAAGSPARVIRYRFNEKIIAALLSLACREGTCRDNALLLELAIINIAVG